MLAASQSPATEQARIRAHALIAPFRGDFLNSVGFISRTNTPDHRTIFDNFDDVAPFLAWWGGSDILRNQVEKLQPGDFERLLPFGNLLHSYKIDEYLGGLNVAAKATQSPKVRALLDDAIG